MAVYNKLPSYINRTPIQDYIDSEGIDVSDYFKNELNISCKDIEYVYGNMRDDCPYFGLSLKTRHADEERTKYRVSCLPIANPTRKYTFNEMINQLTVF